MAETTGIADMIMSKIKSKTGTRAYQLYAQEAKANGEPVLGYDEWDSTNKKQQSDELKAGFDSVKK
jgi:hypothetical protein